MISSQYEEILNNSTMGKPEELEVIPRYLDAIFKNFEKRSGYNRMNLTLFKRLLQIPMIVAEKIFKCLKQDASGLSIEDFTNGLSIFYQGTFEDVVKLAFRIFDFDLDAKIIMEDIQLILTHLHLVKNKGDDLDKMMEIISDNLQDKTFYTYEEFSKIIFQQNCDIILLFVYYVKQINLISKNKLDYFIQHDTSMRNITKISYQGFAMSNTNPNPSTKLRQFLESMDQSRLKKNKLVKNSGSNDLEALTMFEQDVKVALSQAKNALSIKQKMRVRVRNPKFDQKMLTTFFTSRSIARNCMSTNDIIPVSHPSNRKARTIGILRKDENTTLDMLFISTDRLDENENEIILYILKKGKLKKCKLVLIDDVIFYHSLSHKGDLKHFKIIPLISTFVQKCNRAVINTQTYVSFTLISNVNTTRNYCIDFFSLDENSVNLFVEKIRYATKQKSIEEEYTIIKDIGMGKFGNVKLAERNKTSEKVAIKCVSKIFIEENENIEELNNLLTWEKDIFLFLKHCPHPNIVKPIKLYETPDMIYFIYEYIPGGHLKSYLSAQENSFSHAEVTQIVSQLISAVSFLHRFGIVHRDLKPANVLVKKRISEGIVIKLTDFGLSKVLGKYEKTCEPYGSLSYTAPEIIENLSYNHKVDVWSIGIILYYLMFGILPFRDPNGNLNHIREMIIKDELIFPMRRCKLGDRDRGNLLRALKSCLMKNQALRPLINDIFF